MRDSDADENFRRSWYMIVENAIFQGVLSKLKIAKLKLPEAEKRRVVDSERKHLKAFDESSTEVCDTHLVTNKIDIGINLPIK